MQALQVIGFDGAENVRIGSVQIPEVGAHEVLIQVEAAGLNFPDRLMGQGLYQHMPELPFVLGMECAGRVVQVGSAVAKLRIGDRVMSFWNHGAFAQYAAVPGDSAYVIPEQMDFDQASIFGLSYVTAHLGLVRRAGLRSGQTVVVTGASGSVGEAAVHLGKWLGARVIAVSRDVAGTRTRLEGVAAGVVSADPGTLREEILAATDGQGADVVFDVVGGDVLTQAMRALSWEGRAVVVGFAGGGQNPIKPGHLLVKNVGILGVQASDYCTRNPAYVREIVDDMFRGFQEGALPVQEMLTVGPSLLVDQIQGKSFVPPAARAVLRFGSNAASSDDLRVALSSGE